MATAEQAEQTKTYTVEVYDCERDWLQAKLGSLGSSESGIVCGMSNFCGPYGLYCRKIDRRIESDDETFGELSEIGTFLEPLLSEKFTEATGLELHNPGPCTIYRSVERPWMTCTPDRIVAGSNPATPVELKTAWFSAAKEWKKQIPPKYQIQLQHQIYVMGAAEGYFQAFANSFKWFRMDRYDRGIQWMLEKCDEFWERLQKRDPPPLCGHPTTSEELLRQSPQDNGEALQLDDLDLVDAWLKANESLNRSSAERAMYTNRIKQAMGDAAVAEFPNGVKFSYRTNAKGSRTFRKV